MSFRGLSKFEIGNNGQILNNENNLKKLREMFLDRELIYGELLGPGDPGDFDKGAWHILCHLAAGCAVYKKENRMLWVEISHVPLSDYYTATITVDVNDETVSIYPLLSSEGKNLFRGAMLLGFVEGSSLGHISARDVNDSPNRFNNCTRQEFDVDETSKKDGGRVWEHWATTRDISSQSAIGSSVLSSYLSLISFCGGKFASIIARGRKDYFHPQQLLALIKYGLISKDDTLVNISPKPIPDKLELQIYSANPRLCVKVAEKLSWDEKDISYFMFKRRINRWDKDFKI